MSTGDNRDNRERNCSSVFLCFLLLKSVLVPQLPVPPQIIAVKEAQRYDRLVESRGSQFLLIAQMDQMIQHHALGQLFEGTLRMALGQFAHLAQILGFAAPAE